VSIFWDYLSSRPEEEALFDEAMSGAVVTRAKALLATVDLSAVGTLVDIGGGQGWLLAAALEANPSLRGVLFDRPKVLSRAEATLTSPRLRDRCKCVSGDFFASVPDGGDAYVLSQILHDWPDTEATVILRACHRAMRPGARLWIVEQVIEPGDSFDQGKLLDLHMLVLFGVEERTTEEYRSLLDAAGFSRVSVHRTETPFSIVEALRG
jgi:predicted methyltransferase